MANLSEIRDSIQEIKPLERKMSELDQRIFEAESEIAALLKKYEEEAKDIAQLKQISFSSFILKTFRQYEHKMEKEIREEIAAKSAYDEAMFHYNELLERKKETGRKLSELRKLEHDYRSELENRRQELYLGISDSKGQQLKQLEANRQECLSQLTETGDIHNVIVHLKFTVRTALNALQSADRWATYDIWGGSGIITYSQKYSHIDEAENCFHRLRSQLGELKSKLANTKGLTTDGLSEVSSAKRMADYWFDDIFTNASVRNQIRGNIDSLNRLAAYISTVEKSVGKKLAELNAQLAENSRWEEEFLLSL